MLRTTISIELVNCRIVGSWADLRERRPIKLALTWSSSPDNFPIQQYARLFFKMKLNRLPFETTYLFVEWECHLARQCPNR